MEGTMPKWLITTTSWGGAALAAVCAAALALVKFEITTSAGLYFFYGLLVGLVVTGIGFLLGWRTDWRVLIIGVVVVLAIVAAFLAYDFGAAPDPAQTYQPPLVWRQPCDCSLSAPVMRSEAVDDSILAFASSVGQVTS